MSSIRQHKLQQLLANSNLMLQLVEVAESEDTISGSTAANISSAAYRLRNLIGRAYERSMGVLVRYSEYAD